ncbi:hypothetical protein M5D96_009305 [Drosophila gunungcola]|uniref:Uncharacterized protein n=1 Tax=Drosophila gunungcola TaxID=103775 RepID=A0A9Q0BND2_9MUSC|nr:hypothetical protein M5D96_009305 [Drosophila gunungcola]
MSCLVVRNRNRKRNSGSTPDEFDKVSTLANADGSECVSPVTERGQEPDSQAEPEFGHLNETRRKIHDAIAALNDDSFDRRMARLLMQYEGAIREEFERAQYLPLKCRKLARILTGLTDVIHTMVQGRALQQDEGYRQRMCHIVGFYISCELCSAQEPVESEECIINRINSCLKLYVEYGEGGAGVHREHVLRTLLAAPKLFNRASILSMLYSCLFPHWSMPSVMIQAELPDKLYIEYILIFYYWQRLESDESVKERIVEFAEKFMRPSKSLALRSVYAPYLPKFTDRSTATSTILNHLRKSSCTSLHVVSKVDNRPPQSNEVLSYVGHFGYADIISEQSSARFPPESLPECPPVGTVQAGNALFSGIDNSIEIVDLRDSDDDVEMFSVNFNVPANVDGIISNSNSNDSAHQTTATTILGEDDSVPVTRIYPSNLRTYERAVIPPTTYTVPRIVNSYSCRRDSLHLVSTTAPHLVDQCVQTLEEEEEEEEPDLVEEHQYPSALGQNFFPRSSSASDASGQRTPLYHCRQSSSQNSNCSESSLLKKQVTFSPRHLGATAPTAKAGASKKPSIKQYMTKSPVNGAGSLRWKAEHHKASAKMFAKLDAKIKARNEVINVAASQLTPTTSNASSGTPTKISATPTRIRTTNRGQRVALPTPPASTHSSSSPCQIQSVSTDNQSSSDWGSSRRCFPKADGDDVSYYNHLLTLQRENIRRRRLNNQKKKAGKAYHKVEKPVDQQSLLKQATKQCRKLRVLNAKRRKEVQQLEQDLAIIRQSAPHRLPQIRLKRLSLKGLKRSHRAEEALNGHEHIDKVETGGQLQEQTSLEEMNLPRDERKCSKDQQLLEEVNELVEQENIQTQEQTEEKKEVVGRHEHEHDQEHQQFLEEQLLQEQHQLEMHHEQQEELQQAGEEPNLVEDPQEDDQLHVENEHEPEIESPQLEDPDEEEPNQDEDQEQAVDQDEKGQHQVEDHDQAKEELLQIEKQKQLLEEQQQNGEDKQQLSAEPRPEPAYEFDQDMVPEVGNELEIAAPVLAAEDEDSSAMLSPSHNLELVTSHVPVYLLNGESRDVSTPLSSSPFSASGSEPCATSKD